MQYLPGGGGGEPADAFILTQFWKSNWVLSTKAQASKFPRSFTV